MAYAAYIDADYYNNTYHGAAIDSDAFARIALRASDELDALTFQRVRTAGLDSFNAATQEAVMLATCALAEALGQIDAATDGTGIAVTAEKVGSYSYSADAASLTALLNIARMKARSTLWPTGLLYAGI